MFQSIMLMRAWFIMLRVNYFKVLDPALKLPAISSKFVIASVTRVCDPLAPFRGV